MRYRALLLTLSLLPMQLPAADAVPGPAGGVVTVRNAVKHAAKGS